MPIQDMLIHRIHFFRILGSSLAFTSQWYIVNKVLNVIPLTLWNGLPEYSREVANNVAQDHTRDQRGKALFNVKYVTAGTFDVVK